jgi:hypothetical protein
MHGRPNFQGLLKHILGGSAGDRDRPDIAAPARPGGCLPARLAHLFQQQFDLFQLGLGGPDQKLFGRGIDFDLRLVRIRGISDAEEFLERSGRRLRVHPGKLDHLDFSGIGLQLFQGGPDGGMFARLA